MSGSQRITVLAALFCLAGIVCFWQFWPATDERNARDSSSSVQETADLPTSRLDPTPTELRHEFQYNGTGLDLFSSKGPEERPRPRPKAPKPVVPSTSKTEAANLRGRFFGYGSVPIDAPRRALLVLGEEIYIVSEGDILMGRFRIVKINNGTLEFEEVSSGKHGQKMLEDQGQTQGPNA